MKIIRNSVLALAVVSAGSTFAQKKNETSAAVEYKNKYMTAMMTGDMEGAKKALVNAKEFIDLAAAHEETSSSQKTFYYKGEIYAAFLNVGMMSADTNFVKLAGDDPINESILAFDKAWDLGSKMKKEIKDAVYEKRAVLDNFASMAYQGEMYKEAAEMYAYEARYANAVDILDTVALFNSGLCNEKAGQFSAAGDAYAKAAQGGYRGATTYALASSAYRRAGEKDKASAIVNEGLSKHPSDKDLLLESVNSYIEEGNAAGAEKALTDIIAKDPNNKQLHYTIGTIYIELKENEKAETALNKALELDPNYLDAQYQLGAHLVTWAGNLRTEANQMKLGDPNYDSTLEKSNEVYQRALVPLEKYIAAQPNDKAVLTILFQIHRSLGNSEKALEYKKRADAL